jgi:uncharacterized membrane protein YtjA (UPF0391 family)
MLNWAVIFLVLGVIAGVLGFSGVGGTSLLLYLSAFFILTLTGVMMLVAWRRRGRLTS